LKKGPPGRPPTQAEVQKRQNLIKRQNANKPTTLTSSADKTQMDKENNLGAAIGVLSSKSQKMGMLCLKLTNDFRKSEGKTQTLLWN
jgi:hypothetical protein